jgi:hypothetical protein
VVDKLPDEFCLFVGNRSVGQALPLVIFDSLICRRELDVGLLFF